MKSTFGYIFSIALTLVFVQSVNGQDTLRTYGPRVGVDLARFVYYFTDPPEIGAEVSVDVEVFNNFFPIFELGFSSLSDSLSEVKYGSEGAYARIGLDYNVLPVNDRSIHHSITLGFRYATSIFKHSAENITVPSSYWGDYYISTYENALNGHWMELVGGIKAEVLPNLFLGWNIRYKILLNANMDPRVTPLMIPGFGNGAENRAFGFTYSISYKFPILKR